MGKERVYSYVDCDHTCYVTTTEPVFLFLSDKVFFLFGPIPFVLFLSQNSFVSSFFFLFLSFFQSPYDSSTHSFFSNINLRIRAAIRLNHSLWPTFFRSAHYFRPPPVCVFFLLVAISPPPPFSSSCRPSSAPSIPISWSACRRAPWRTRRASCPSASAT